MRLTTKNIEVTVALAGRADRVVRHLSEKSLSEVRGLFDHDCVTINGERCEDGATIVAAGDCVEIKFDPQQRYRPRERAWSDDSFKIVFEDKHLIVVDKSAGVLTVPANSGESGSLLEALGHYFSQRSNRARPQPVHRLDRGASGLLVFGKDRDVAAKLQSQFEARKPGREYMVIVNGVLDAKEGTFESYIATSKSLQQFSTNKPGEGKLAITHFRLEKVARGASYFRVQLETGRRNQIRVHFAEAGHPVLGDPRYAPEKSAHPQWRVKRLALHAASLSFVHPITEKTVHFESPMPGPMQTFLRK